MKRTLYLGALFMILTQAAPSHAWGPICVNFNVYYSCNFAGKNVFGHENPGDWGVSFEHLKDGRVMVSRNCDTDDVGCDSRMDLVTATRDLKAGSQEFSDLLTKHGGTDMKSSVRAKVDLIRVYEIKHYDNSVEKERNPYKLVRYFAKGEQVGDLMIDQHWRDTDCAQGRSSGIVPDSDKDPVYDSRGTSCEGNAVDQSKDPAAQAVR